MSGLSDRIGPAELAATMGADLRALPVVNTATMRSVRRSYSQWMSQEVRGMSARRIGDRAQIPSEVTWTLDGDEASWAGWAEVRAGAPASPLVQELIAAHPPSPGAWALDVGCGTGSAFSPLTAAGYQVLGLDPTIAAVEHSLDRIRREGLPARTVRASAARLPIASRSTTFVLAMATLFHLGPAELRDALAEVRRVLVGDGRAILHFLDAADWRCSLAPEIRLVEVPRPAYRAIVTCFASEGVIRHWIDSAGLEILSLELRTSQSDAGEQRNWIVICRRSS